MSDDNPTDPKARLHDVIMRAGLTRAEAATLLSVSPHTMRAWLKPATSQSSNPVPPWAIELLEFKTGLRRAPRRAAPQS